MYDFIFSLYSKVIFGVLFTFFSAITIHYYTLREQNKFLLFLFFTGLFCWALVIIFLKTNTFLEPKFKGILKPLNKSIIEHPTYIYHFNKMRTKLENELQTVHSEKRKIEIENKFSELDSLHKKGFFIFLGKGIVHTFSDKLTVIELQNKPVLSIKIKNNSIFISGIFFSEDNRISAKIKDNVFAINENNWFSIVRPNKFAFILRDNFDKELLNVDFFNPRAVRINGIFRVPNSFPLIITNEYIEYNTNRFFDLFSYGTGAVGISIN